MTVDGMISAKSWTVNVPGQNVDVCDAQLALAWASEVFATLETDVEYVVQTGGLVDITWKKVDKNGNEDDFTTHVSCHTGYPLGHSF